MGNSAIIKNYLEVHVSAICMWKTDKIRSLGCCMNKVDVLKLWLASYWLPSTAPSLSWLNRAWLSVRLSCASSELVYFALPFAEQWEVVMCLPIKLP